MGTFLRRLIMLAIAGVFTGVATASVPLKEWRMTVFCGLFAISFFIGAWGNWEDQE